MYKVVADILKNMCTDEKTKMGYHMLSCQRNEMMNRKVSANCPKDKKISSTTSLKNRIDFLIMRYSLDEYQAINMVLELIGMKIPLSTENYLIVKDTKNSQKCVHHLKKDLIKKRSGIMQEN